MAVQFSLTGCLRDLEYFADMKDAALNALAGDMTFQVFTPNEIIFLEGDPAQGLWIVEEGSVKIYKLNPDGGEHILHLLGPGNTFNDIAALDGGPNPATAATLSAVSAWMLPAVVLKELLAADNRLAQRVIHILAHRVRTLVHQIEDLALYSTTIRLARFLLKQGENPALAGPGVTRATIAAHLAATPETISRALRSLETSGAIRFDRHRIVIVREELLRALAEL